MLSQNERKFNFLSQTIYALKIKSNLRFCIALRLNSSKLNAIFDVDAIKMYF